MGDGEATRRARKMLLCAAGGFQAYSLPGFVLALLKHLADDVQVVLSRAAAGMVSRYALEVASRHPVYVEMTDGGEGVYVPHIELSRGADFILVYPATANILGKVAQGIVDELISALIIAADVPVFFVPIMNPSMWRHPAVQRNVRTLQDDGYTVLPLIENIEIATREGLEEANEPFPLPTLLLRLQAAIAGSGRGSVQRQNNV
jgi:phosphopantothenoylcysteine decarboxylase/phosphopantothenate--cysteine ligase